LFITHFSQEEITTKFTKNLDFKGFLTFSLKKKLCTFPQLLLFLTKLPQSGRNCSRIYYFLCYFPLLYGLNLLFFYSFCGSKRKRKNPTSGVLSGDYEKEKF